MFTLTPIILALLSLTPASPAQEPYYPTYVHRLGIRNSTTQAMLELIARPESNLTAQERLQRDLRTQGGFRLVFEQNDFALAQVWQVSVERGRERYIESGNTAASRVLVTEYERRENPAPSRKCGKGMSDHRFTTRLETCYSNPEIYDAITFGGEEALPLGPALSHAAVFLEAFADGAAPRALAQYKLRHPELRTLDLDSGVVFPAALKAAGFEIDLDHPYFWVRTGSIDPEAKKLIAAAEVFEANKQVYVSINTRCPGRVEDLGLKGPRVLPLERYEYYTSVGACSRSSYLVFPEAIYEELEKQGYEYANGAWTLNVLKRANRLKRAISDDALDGLD